MEIKVEEKKGQNYLNKNQMNFSLTLLSSTTI